MSLTDEYDKVCTLCGKKKGMHSSGNFRCPNPNWNNGDSIEIRFHPALTFSHTGKQSTATSPSGGMRCAVKFCAELNPYAVANVGKDYVCYSCRQSGKKP